MIYESTETSYRLEQDGYADFWTYYDVFCVWDILPEAYLGYQGDREYLGQLRDYDPASLQHESAREYWDTEAMTLLGRRQCRCAYSRELRDVSGQYHAIELYLQGGQFYGSDHWGMYTLNDCTELDQYYLARSHRHLRPQIVEFGDV